MVTMLRPLVYIVILNYNGEKWVNICLESLIRTNYDNFKILFVDNASNDNSIELAKKFLPQIELIINPSNLGFSEGNNRGIRVALANSADYIVLLNPDTKVEPEWLASLVEVGECHQEIGILGSVQLNYDDDGFNSWTKTALPQLLDELEKPDSSREWIPVEWVEGACFVVKRRVFEKIGLLDPIYFAFYEEIDFCRRAACQAYQVALVSRSRVHHYRGGSWQANQKTRRERDYRCDRSQFIFNLTDPRKSFFSNLSGYLITLATKVKGLQSDFSLTRTWDLLRIQSDVLVNSGKLVDKWRRERLLIRKEPGA